MVSCGQTLQDEDNSRREKLGHAQRETSYSSFRRSEHLPNYACTERLFRGQRVGYHPLIGDVNIPIGLISILTKRCGVYTHIEINQIWTQSQAKQSDWPKETWKKCPIISDSNYHEGMALSLSVCLCVPIHLYFFLLINTLFVSLHSASL